jgi:hypothetical protein
VGRHLKEVEGCKLREIDIGDGITSEIVERLKSKKRAHRDETEEDRWQKIYVLLFPGSSVPPPCKFDYRPNFLLYIKFPCIDHIIAQILSSQTIQPSWKSTKNIAGENSLVLSEPRLRKL